MADNGDEGKSNICSNNQGSGFPSDAEDVRSLRDEDRTILSQADDEEALLRQLFLNSGTVALNRIRAWTAGRSPPLPNGRGYFYLSPPPASVCVEFSPSELESQSSFQHILETLEAVESILQDSVLMNNDQLISIESDNEEDLFLPGDVSCSRMAPQ
jgi:hypothetical protein